MQKHVKIKPKQSAGSQGLVLGGIKNKIGHVIHKSNRYFVKMKKKCLFRGEKVENKPSKYPEFGLDRKFFKDEDNT
jgi:hypothetical protein